MKILLDANISWRLVKVLNLYFSEVIHTFDLPLEQPAKDIEIWNYAKENNFTIISQDDDFEKLVLSKGAPLKIILLKTFNKKNTVLQEIILSNKDKIEIFILSKESEILEIYN